MSKDYHIENDCLILKIPKLYDSLSDTIKDNYINSKAKHLILDLSSVKNITDKHIENFINFGKNIVCDNSFVLISNLFFDESLPIVPTLQEAFDFIEMEDIERLLTNNE